MVWICVVLTGLDIALHLLQLLVFRTLLEKIILGIAPRRQAAVRRDIAGGAGAAYFRPLQRSSVEYVVYYLGISQRHGHQWPAGSAAGIQHP